MHPRILAERTALADKSIAQSAAALANALGLPEDATAGLAVKSGRLAPEVARMMEREAMAALLAEVVPLVDLLREERDSLAEVAAALEDKERKATKATKATKAKTKGGE